MDPAEEEHQARRAEKRAQQYVVPALLQNIPSAPVWNRGKERERFHITPAHVPQTLENAILDLCRCQLTEQQQRITQEYRAQVITRVEASMSISLGFSFLCAVDSFSVSSLSVSFDSVF